MTVRRLPSRSRFAPVIGFSTAVVAGPWVVTAGMTAVAEDGSVTGDGPYDQAREALRKLVAAVTDAGGSTADVVQTRTYLVDAADWSEVGRAHGEVFGVDPPASTMVVVAALLDPRMRVEVEALAYLGP